MMKLDEDELKRAMKLISDLRARQHKLKVGSVVMRVALKYLLLCDDHFAERKLSFEVNEEINAYARFLFAKTRGELRDLYV